MKTIDYIIPISNSGNLDFIDRVINLNFILKTFLTYQTNVDLKVYLIEQIIDPNIERFSDYINIPTNLTVIIKTVNFPIFCKPWLYNIGIKMSDGDNVILGDLDNWVDRNYFEDLVKFVDSKELKWCFAWSRLVLLSKERKEKLINHNILDYDENNNILPDKESHEPYLKNFPEIYTPEGYIISQINFFSGNAILFKRDFLVNEIYGVNELFKQWGMEDIELLYRASKISGTIESFPIITTHLWHTPSIHVHNSSFNFNKKLVYDFLYKDDNFMIMNNILRDENIGNEEYPLDIEKIFKKYNINIE